MVGAVEGEGCEERGLRYHALFSPEVNPVERVFEEVQGYVEGQVYRPIEAKKAAVEAVLMRLGAEQRISTLVGGVPSFTRMIAVVLDAG